jgi:hypothetical protein
MKWKRQELIRKRFFFYIVSVPMNTKIEFYEVEETFENERESVSKYTGEAGVTVKVCSKYR